MCLGFYFGYKSVSSYTSLAGFLKIEKHSVVECFSMTIRIVQTKPLFSANHIPDIGELWKCDWRK
jgi:hypothetical protein